MAKFRSAFVPISYDWNISTHFLGPNVLITIYWNVLNKKRSDYVPNKKRPFQVIFYEGWSGMTQNNIIVKKAINPTIIALIIVSGAAQTEMPIKIYMLDRICHFFRRGMALVLA